MLPEAGRFRLRDVQLTLDEDAASLPGKVAARFGLAAGEIIDCRLVRQGLDARKKSRICHVCTVDFVVADPTGFWQQHQGAPDLAPVEPEPAITRRQIASDKRVIIVGTGPAGLFAALRLTDYGIRPLVLERGQGIEQRVRAVERFWQTGQLDPESNVQFGEGGAGTFSDGKLTTRVRDPNAGYVLRRFVEFGAPEQIGWLAKPHIGTDRLRLVLINLRRHLLACGAEVRFGARLSGIVESGRTVRAAIVNDRDEEPCDHLILAPGHSSRDTYAMLDRLGVPLEQKAFAVGFRVEHPQELINAIQYGRPADPRLPAADYGLAWNDTASGRSAYSFCMCPGGLVIGCSSEPETVVTNGMSNLRRNSGWANSALVTTVKTADFPGSSPLAGIELQRSLERAAYQAGGSSYRAPAQNLLGFLGQGRLAPAATSFRPGVTEADLAGLLPPAMAETLRHGIRHFDRKMRGFVTAEATLLGVESRTSAPLRIIRGENCESTGLAGFYPCGEGAGYAGGIMSAALDGIRVADAIAARMEQQ